MVRLRRGLRLRLSFVPQFEELPQCRTPNVFGRDAQFAWLEQAWQHTQTNFVQIIAQGSAGKTALMSRWYRQHVADVTIFGWSFYTQGTDNKSQTSSDLFLAEALGWFKIDAPATASTYSKVDLLAARLRQEPVLMILDGVEPLQEPSGSLRDLALKSLLQELTGRNAGMVLVTTRVRLTDIPDDAPRSVSLDLENLDPADGARYLAYLGVRGEEDELRRASEEYWNHALAITLLGTYLADFCGGDIRRRVEIPELMVEDAEHGAHARRVIAAYEKMFAGKPELEILRAVGYFNWPGRIWRRCHLVLPKIKIPAISGSAEASFWRPPNSEQRPGAADRLPSADPGVLRGGGDGGWPCEALRILRHAGATQVPRHARGDDSAFPRGLPRLPSHAASGGAGRNLP